MEWIDVLLSNSSITNSPRIKEILLILNQLLIGIKEQQQDVVEKTVNQIDFSTTQYILDEILSPDILNLQISRDQNDTTHLTSITSKDSIKEILLDNTIITSLLIDTIGSIANILPTNKNHMKYLNLYPNTPNIFEGILNITGLGFLPFLSDTVRMILYSLDLAIENSNDTTTFIQILFNIVKVLYNNSKFQLQYQKSIQSFQTQTQSTKIDLNDEPQDDQKEPTSIEDIKSFFMEHHKNKEAKEQMHSYEASLEAKNQLLKKKLELEELKKQYPPQFFNIPEFKDTTEVQRQLVEEIVNKCSNFISSKNQTTKITSMNIIEMGFVIVATGSKKYGSEEDNEDDQDDDESSKKVANDLKAKPKVALYPLIHKVWDTLVKRVSEPNRVTSTKALEIIQTIADLAHDFITHRFWNHLWPVLKKILFDEQKKELHNNNNNTVNINNILPQKSSTLTTTTTATTNTKLIQPITPTYDLDAQNLKQQQKKFTPSYKIQNVILKTIYSVLKSGINMNQQQVVDLSIFTLPYLSSKQPEPFQEITKDIWGFTNVLLADFSPILTQTPKVYGILNNGLVVNTINPSTGETAPFYQLKTQFRQYNKIVYMNSTDIFLVGLRKSQNTPYIYDHINMNDNTMTTQHYNGRGSIKLEKIIMDPSGDFVYLYDYTNIITSDPKTLNKVGSFNIKTPSAASISFFVDLNQIFIDFKNRLLYLYFYNPPMPTDFLDQKDEDLTTNPPNLPCAFVTGCCYLITYDLDSQNLISHIDLTIQFNPLFTMGVPISKTSIISLHALPGNTTYSIVDFNPTNGQSTTLATITNQYYPLSTSVDIENQLFYIFMSEDGGLNHNTLYTYNIDSKTLTSTQIQGQSATNYYTAITVDSSIYI
eukprot:gene5986-7458_t